MSKYSKVEKIAAILDVEKGESISEVARRNHIDVDMLSLYLRLYRDHGEEGIQSHAYNWTAAQKYQVLSYMHENHLSCKETGIKFGISGSSTIWQWEKRYLENGIEGLEDKKKGRKTRVQKPKPPKTREEELLERIQYLEVENAYLKKLNALVAEREKRERGNR